MSISKQPNALEAYASEIAGAADDAGSQAEVTSESARIANLEDRLAELEPLFEQLQSNVSLGTKLTDYVGDLRSEQVFFNKARNVVGCLILAVVIFAILLLALAIFHSASPLLKSPPAAIATVVIGLSTSIALMLSAFVKGVFRSTAERHADGFLPPALEKSLEIFNKINGKG